MCLCWTANTVSEVHSLELLKSPVWLSSILRHPMYPNCLCHFDYSLYFKLLRSCYILLRMRDLISSFSIRKQVSSLLHDFCFVLSRLFSSSVERYIRVTRVEGFEESS